MGHIELRAVDDDDLDAVFEMTCEPAAIALVAFIDRDAADRAAFDEWIVRTRAMPDASLYVVTDRGGFAGMITAVTAGGDREVTCWLARHAWGRGVATQALRLLVSREATRPLVARVAAHNAAAIAALQRNGFTEASHALVPAQGLGRDVEQIVYTLLPALE
ncbi:hypothetical protein GCM10022240_02050 [Microbacterium kribbense]|uniref:N-acetyltransferase domain-containing protein n=1 Tax=Microbacterium kribbense TaxID=433645 RepID=A0ABP7G2X2_9MICO